MDPLTTIRRRLAVQRLSADRLGTPVAVVRWLGAMQGQEYAEVKWSIARRMGTEVADAVIEDAFASGALVRTHLLRPTWHVVAAADLRWILALTAPRVHAVNKYWYTKLGLDEAVLARGMAVIDRAVSDGEAHTRTELGVALEADGITVDRLALTYLVMYAELEALVCSGPRRGKQQTYMSVDARVAPTATLDREEALAELLSRYLRSRGPATVKDFTTWSGLTVADAKAGLALVGDELVCEVDGEGTAWWSAPDAPAAPASTGAHLIPMYDELTIAYRQARVVLAAQPPRSGLLERPILVDGTTIGSWKRTLTARTVTIEATLFRELDGAASAAVEDEVARFGRFLERSATLAAISAPGRHLCVSGRTDGRGSPDGRSVESIKIVERAMGMKSSESPSQLIDARIKELGDWRGETLSRLRALVKDAVPDVVEEWKWRGVPVWYHDGILCTGETYKSIVKMTFAKGAALEDPSDLFNSSLDGNTRRAIDFHEGEEIDEEALKTLVRAAAALNESQRRR